MSIENYVENFRDWLEEKTGIRLSLLQITATLFFLMIFSVIIAVAVLTKEKRNQKTLSEKDIPKIEEPPFVKE